MIALIVGLFRTTVDRNDVRMVQRRDHLRFALEAIGHLGICGDVGQQHLDRHTSLELQIESEVDDRHGASADLSVDRDFAGEQRANLVRELRRPRRLPVFSAAAPHREQNVDFAGTMAPQRRHRRSSASAMVHHGHAAGAVIGELRQPD